MGWPSVCDCGISKSYSLVFTLSVLLLAVLCVSSSRYHGLVYCLWHFLIIITCFYLFLLTVAEMKWGMVQAYVDK